MDESTGAHVLEHGAAGGLDPDGLAGAKDIILAIGFERYPGGTVFGADDFTGAHGARNEFALGEGELLTSDGRGRLSNSQETEKPQPSKI